MATEQELSDFLRSVDKRAFKRTLYAVRDEDAALDIVQDAMVRLAQHYADRPAAELPLVFQRLGWSERRATEPARTPLLTGMAHR